DKYLRWDPNPEGFTPQVGQKFRVRCNKRVDEGGYGNGEWIVHYECIHSELTSGSPEPDFWTLGCQTPDLSIAWTNDTRVKVGTSVGTSKAGHETALGVQVAGEGEYNKYKKTGLGPDEPEWDYTPGATTPDGTAVWIAVDPKIARGAVIRDGKAVFACRTA